MESVSLPTWFLEWGKAAIYHPADISQVQAAYLFVMETEPFIAKQHL